MLKFRRTHLAAIGQDLKGIGVDSMSSTSDGRSERSVCLGPNSGRAG